MAKTVSSKDVPRVLSLFLAYYKAERGIAPALEQVATAEAKYAKSLNKVASDIMRNGTAFDVALRKEQVFNDDIIFVLGAGQTSGQLEKVLVDVTSTIKKQNLMIGNVIKSVSYQLSLLLAIILITPYLLFNIAEATPKGSSLRELAAQMQLLMNSVPGIEFVYPVAILSFVTFVVTSDHARKSLIAGIGGLPVVKNALINYQTGLWCNYAGLMLRAGLTITDVERLLRPTVIQSLQEAFKKIANVVVDKGWSDALDVIEDHDVRSTIPPIARSFMRSGGQSGLLDTQLKEAAEFLLETANNQFEFQTKLIGVFVMLIVAAGVMALAMQVYLTRL